jgi:oxalate decarboxylase
MLKGSARVTAIDEQGRNYMAEVNEGDLWYFPSGPPHSIQALQDGCEFLLMFHDGAFSENSTFLITDWFAHTPKEVLAKNFALPETAFAHIPSKELYMFQEPVPPPAAQTRITAPNGAMPTPSPSS